MREYRPRLTANLAGIDAAQQFFQSWFALCDLTRETLWVAHLDDHRDCIFFTGFEGDEAGVANPVRAIIADVIRYQSVGMLLAHNHPSGDSRPSDADCRLTRDLATVARALDCTVLDHFILGGEDFTSFRQTGLL